AAPGGSRRFAAVRGRAFDTARETPNGGLCARSSLRVLCEPLRLCVMPSVAGPERHPPWSRPQESLLTPAVTWVDPMIAQRMSFAGKAYRSRDLDGRGEDTTQ